MPVLSSYVGDHAALLRMSANADFSTLLKCLASGKKSIEQLRPSAPRQTSALELLEVYCFLILLVYPRALYYGMLILSRALGACPTPPGSGPLSHSKYINGCNSSTLPVLSVVPQGSVLGQRTVWELYVNFKLYICILVKAAPRPSVLMDMATGAGLRKRLPSNKAPL